MLSWSQDEGKFWTEMGVEVFLEKSAQIRCDDPHRLNVLQQPKIFFSRFSADFDSHLCSLTLVIICLEIQPV